MRHPRHGSEQHASIFAGPMIATSALALIGTPVLAAALILLSFDLMSEW